MAASPGFRRALPWECVDGLGAPRLPGHSQQNAFSAIALVPFSGRGSRPVQGSKARQVPLLPSPPPLLHRASHQQPQTLLLITSCKSTLCGEMGRTGWGQGGKVMVRVSSPHSDSARTPGEDPTSLACIHMYGCPITNLLLCANPQSLLVKAKFTFSTSLCLWFVPGLAATRLLSSSLTASPCRQRGAHLDCRLTPVALSCYCFIFS